jgi:hypothetical protein
MRNTRKEQIISASPLSTDIIKHERHVGKVPEALIQDRLNFQRLRSRKVSLEGHQRHLGGRSALRCSRNRQDVLDLLRCFRTLSIGQLVEQLAL